MFPPARDIEKGKLREKIDLNLQSAVKPSIFILVLGLRFEVCERVGQLVFGVS